MSLSLREELLNYGHPNAIRATLGSQTKEALIDAYYDELYNNFLAAYCNLPDGSGKRINYIGFQWPYQSFSKGEVYLGDCGLFRGFCSADTFYGKTIKLDTTALYGISDYISYCMASRRDTEKLKEACERLNSVINNVYTRIYK